MQVILLDRIAKLGKLGEVVRVRDGYARNFLIPKGLAKRATQRAIADFERQKVELEQKASGVRVQAFWDSGRNRTEGRGRRKIIWFGD